MGRHLANVDLHPLVPDIIPTKPQTTIKPSVLTNILALQQVSRVGSENNSESEGEDGDGEELMSSKSSEDARVCLKNSNSYHSF